MAQLTHIIAAQGYDTAKLRSVPQQWPLHPVEEEHTQ
jgi:hypothetical protein